MAAGPNLVVSRAHGVGKSFNILRKEGDNKLSPVVSCKHLNVVLRMTSEIRKSKIQAAAKCAVSWPYQRNRAYDQGKHGSSRKLDTSNLTGKSLLESRKHHIALIQ